MPLDKSKGVTRASFAESASGSSLTGGANTSSTPATIYSLSIPPSGGYAPNGNILNANDSVNGNWTYAYDDFNRLKTSSKTGQAFSYGYDRYGNRWNQTATTGSGPQPSFSFDANNRMVGYSYDAAGNVVNDGTHSYSYDAENRIVSVDGGVASYVYDVSGQRVRKVSASGTVDYLYDLAGHSIAEINTSGAWNRLEIFAAGRHLATYNNGTAYFTHGDWLGTERMRSAVNGTVYETCTNLPFGDGHSCTGGDPSPNHFTGKERDSETGLDYFGARYYGSSLGRFISVDPKAASSKLANPQSWNRYSYVLNNPLALFDPDGKEAYFAVQGNNINVQINVLLTGNATPKMAAAFQQSANRTLGGAREATVNGQKYNVNIQVNASTDPKSLPNAQTRGQNTLNINNNAFKTEVNNDGKTGTAKTGDLEQGNVPGHESLHFAGLKDEYVPGAVNTVVNGTTGESFQYQSGFVVPGTENNVMSNPENPNAQLTQQNVNQLANTAVQMQQQAPTPEKKEEPK